jgi:DNA-binding response OmpR family regulator
MKNLTAGAKILVIDDEKRIREMLQIGLERKGFAVRSLADGRSIGTAIDEWQPDVVLLDVMLPYADGFALLPQVRRRTQAPIIMLTAKGDVDDRVTGLELGADDYLAKPFALNELVARINAALRRPVLQPDERISFADLVVNLNTREVRRGETIVSLTNREYSLLVTLAREPRRVFSKEQLLDLAWGHDFDGDTGVVETYVSYLRGKIDAGHPVKLIHTIRGAGYSMRAGQA